MHLPVSVIDGDITTSLTKTSTLERILVAVHLTVYDQSFESFLIVILCMCLALFMPLLI